MIIGDLLHWFCPGDLSDLGPRWEWRYLRSRAGPGVDQTASWVNLGETKGKGKPTGRNTYQLEALTFVWCAFFFAVYLYVKRFIHMFNIYIYACCLYLESSIQMNAYMRRVEAIMPPAPGRRCTKESSLRPRILRKVASRHARCPQRPTFFWWSDSDSLNKIIRSTLSERTMLSWSENEGEVFKLRADR